MLRGRLSVIRIVVLFPYKFALLQFSQFLERVSYHSVLYVVRGTLIELMYYRTTCIHQSSESAQRLQCGEMTWWVASLAEKLNALAVAK